MASNHNVLSVGELQEWLNKKADIEEVKLTDFSDAFAKMLNYNTDGERTLWVSIYQ